MSMHIIHCVSPAAVKLCRLYVPLIFDFDFHSEALVLAVQTVKFILKGRITERLRVLSCTVSCENLSSNMDMYWMDYCQ